MFTKQKLGFEKSWCAYFFTRFKRENGPKTIFLVKLKTRLLHTFESSLKISIFYSSHFPSCLRNKESTAFKYKLWAKCLTWLNLPPSPLNFSADSVTWIGFLGKREYIECKAFLNFCLIFAIIWRFYKIPSIVLCFEKIIR